MAKVALHRITDWPVARHALPVLRFVGALDEVLDRVHWFGPPGLGVIDRIPEVGARPELEPALLSVGRALADFGWAWVEIGDDDAWSCGFHWSASEDELAAALEGDGHQVVRVRERLGRREGERIDDEIMLSVLELRGLAPSVKKRVMAYLREGGVMPELPVVEDVPILFLDEAAIENWTAFELRRLDVFVALSGRKECPRLSVGSGKDHPYLDRAGTLADALLARGVSDDVIFDALIAERSGLVHDRHHADREAPQVDLGQGPPDLLSLRSDRAPR